MKRAKGAKIRGSPTFIGASSTEDKKDVQEYRDRAKERREKSLVRKKRKIELLRRDQNVKKRRVSKAVSSLVVDRTGGRQGGSKIRRKSQGSDA